jgi:hypothetical protein
MNNKKNSKKEVMFKPDRKKLNKWYLFLTYLLNFLQSKTVVVYSLLFIMLVCFGFGYYLKYPAIRSVLELEHKIQIENELKERKEIENKVRSIMELYNCDSLIIYESLLDTFDPVLMATVLAIESEYKVNAISPAGALGLGQVMPYHFKKGQDWKNPKDNIAVASKLMEDFLKRFNDNKELALAAYNAGPGAVVKAGYQIPNTRDDETKKYVLKAQKIDRLIN